ncbi:MAG: carboxypeptidase regulatory-like domain-containing protein [Acidobacteriia bacterium]|nr:carboxypeptidase regulatory-like domain-containing protein [Terriglobia bacterium]
MNGIMRAARRIRRNSLIFPLLASLSLPVLPTSLCFSQATTGTIAGHVTDPQARVVPGVEVKAANEATGLSQRTSTDGSGKYLLAKLPPGTYTITLSKQGFRVAQLSHLALSIDQEVRADTQLEIGAISEHISVVAPATGLQTQTAETSEVIRSRQILDLPLLGRNFLDLARLTAGVQSGSQGNNVNLSISGQREFANSILVDGVEVTTNRNNDTSLRPSVDSVEEFKVLTSSYAPEFGRSAGGVIAIQTKAGTNRFHGSLYEFLRPNATAAKTFFSLQPPELNQHNFGGTLGGPLKKGRTFFFVSYERERLRDAFSFLDSVPPVDQVRFLPNGDVDLSSLKDPRTGKQIPIFDPNTSQRFPGNIIPSNRVSAAGEATLLNFFPRPTLPGILNGWFNNFNSHQRYAFDLNTGDSRIDHYFSDTDRIFVAYHYGDFGSLLGDRFAGHIPVSGGGDADTGDQTQQRSQSVSLAETHLLSARWSNEIRLGYTRFSLSQLSLLNNRNLAAQFGVGNVNLPGFPQTAGFPAVFLGSGYQTGGSTFKPLFFQDRNVEVADSLIGGLGRHQFRAGVDYRRLTSKPRFSFFPTGFQFYGGPFASLTSDPYFSFFDPNAFYGNGGSDVADLLLGLPLTVTEGLQLTTPTTRSWEGSGYVQDSWQATNRFVLLYGIRYEYQSPYTEARNQAATFDLASGAILLAGRGGNSDSLVRPDKNNFAPRVGFALQVTPRTVLRAGYGIHYSPENDARSDILTKNYPYAVEQSFFNDIFSGPPFSYYLDTGVPRITSIPLSPAVARLTPGEIETATNSQQNVFSVAPDFPAGYSQMYSLTLQREITSTTTLEAGYVGSVSHKLPYAVGNLNANHRITDALGQIQAQFAVGSASYNALQVKATKRYSSHLSFLASYTFGKTMDNGPAPFNLGHNLNAHNQPQNPLDLARERSVADDDITHNLVFSYIYELPFGRDRQFPGNRSSIWRAVLGGWQVNGIFVAHSGSPINVVRGIQDSGLEGLRPDLLRDPNLPPAKRTLQEYFDVSAFDTSRFTGSHLHDVGNAPRNVLRGPGFVNLDLSVFKGARLKEWGRVQFRVEFFNLANTPHFANPNGSMSAGNFGSITQTIGNPRIIQFAAKVEF